MPPYYVSLEVRPRHAWPAHRVETCLDFGHDPRMGPALEALSLGLTGDVHPSTPAPEVAWSVSVLDLEQGFPFAEGTLDAMTAFEVIEHVRSIPLVPLRESFRVLRPGGLLYLGTPNVVAWAKIRRNWLAGAGAVS